MMESLGKKKFGIFIKALHRQAGDRQDYFVAGLFDAIGADKRIDISLENAVKNWVAGNNQSYKKRFKGKEFKQEQYNAFLKFLKEKINVRFKDVQSELKNYSAEYPYINFETDNQEVFFASVLNQFTEIVELPLPETANQFRRSEDCHEKQEQTLLVEIPSEQMRKEFEHLVEKYNIATYICNISKYLCEEEPFYVQDSFDFIDAIRTNILSQFLSHQKESIFTKIVAFNHTLKTYSSLLGMIRLSLYEEYGVIELGSSNDEIIDLIDENRKAIKKMEVKDGTSESQISEMEEKLIQLDFLRSILLSHKQLCELFGEICPDKTMFVF